MVVEPISPNGIRRDSSPDQASKPSVSNLPVGCAPDFSGRSACLPWREIASGVSAKQQVQHPVDDLLQDQLPEMSMGIAVIPCQLKSLTPNWWTASSTAARAS